MPALQHERSTLAGRMDDLANAQINLGALFSKEQLNTYEQWCRLHKNMRISKVMDDRSSAISKRSHRSKTSGKSTSTKTSNSSLRRSQKCWLRKLDLRLS